MRSLKTASLEKMGRFIRLSFYLQDCQYLLPPVMLSIGAILIYFYLVSTLLQNLTVLQLLKLVFTLSGIYSSLYYPVSVFLSEPCVVLGFYTIANLPYVFGVYEVRLCRTCI
jgi:hypothetical protein